MIELPKETSNKEKHPLTEEQLQVITEVFAKEILESINKEMGLENL